MVKKTIWLCDWLYVNKQCKSSKLQHHQRSSCFHRNLWNSENYLQFPSQVTVRTKTSEKKSTKTVSLTNKATKFFSLFWPYICSDLYVQHLWMFCCIWCCFVLIMLGRWFVALDKSVTVLVQLSAVFLYCSSDTLSSVNEITLLYSSSHAVFLP